MQSPILLAATAPALNLGTLVLVVLAAALVAAAYRLCGVLAEINKTLAKSANPAPPAAAPVATKAPPTTPAAYDDGIAPEIIAAIAAAVATVAGKSHRILSIKPMSTSWERAGRQSVLTSHRIR